MILLATKVLSMYLHLLEVCLVCLYEVLTLQTEPTQNFRIFEEINFYDRQWKVLWPKSNLKESIHPFVVIIYGPKNRTVERLKS